MGSEDLKIACLLCWPTCFSDKLGWQIPRKCLLEWVLGQLGKKGRSLEKIYVVCWRWEMGGVIRRESVPELGVTWGPGLGGEEERWRPTVGLSASGTVLFLTLSHYSLSWPGSYFVTQG